MTKEDSDIPVELLGDSLDEEGVAPGADDEVPAVTAMQSKRSPAITDVTQAHIALRNFP